MPAPDAVLTLDPGTLLALRLRKITQVEVFHRQANGRPQDLDRAVTAVEEQGAATREIARNIQSVAAGSNEISAHIGGVSTAAAATGKAASEVLASARELDTQSGMLRSAVDEFLGKVRAA